MRYECTKVRNSFEVQKANRSWCIIGELLWFSIWWYDCTGGATGEGDASANREGDGGEEKKNLAEVVGTIGE